MVIARARVALPAAAGVAVLLGVAGCGSGSSGGSGLPTVTGPTGTSATTTGTTDAATTGSSTAAPTGASPDPSPWTALPTISSGLHRGTHQGAVLGDVAAATADDRAVAQAWLAYWAYVSKAQYEVLVDRAVLDSVAVGKAAAGLEGYVKSLRSRNAQTIGNAVFNLTSIRIDGGNATVKGCVVNGSVDVDRKTQRPVEDFKPTFYAIGVLASDGARWRVAAVRVDYRACKAGE